MLKSQRFLSPTFRQKRKTERFFKKAKKADNDNGNGNDNKNDNVNGDGNGNENKNDNVNGGEVENKYPLPPAVSDLPHLK